MYSVYMHTRVLVGCFPLCARGSVFIYSFHPACLPFVSTEISAAMVNKSMHTCINTRYELWPACVGTTTHKLRSVAAIHELSEDYCLIRSTCDHGNPLPLISTVLLALPTRHVFSVSVAYSLCGIAFYTWYYSGS